MVVVVSGDNVCGGCNVEGLREEHQHSRFDENGSGNEKVEISIERERERRGRWRWVMPLVVVDGGVVRNVRIEPLKI